MKQEPLLIICTLIPPYEIKKQSFKPLLIKKIISSSRNSRKYTKIILLHKDKGTYNSNLSPHPSLPPSTTHQKWPPLINSNDLI